MARLQLDQGHNNNNNNTTRARPWQREGAVLIENRIDVRLCFVCGRMKAHLIPATAKGGHVHGG